jgi:hypothetical protein
MTTLKHISVIGDSQAVLGTSFGVQGFECWPALMQSSLIASGYNVRVHTYATGGHDTGNLLDRISDGFAHARPEVAVLAIGVNDAGVYTASQTQANIQAAIKALKHRAIGNGYESCTPAATVSALPATGAFGQRYVVMSDTSTTGGLAAFDPGHHTTITGSVAADANGTKQSVWEYRYPAPAELGWGRVAVTATPPLEDQDDALLGTDTVVVVSVNYLNFTSTGDTPSTPYATNAAIRVAQQAAVTAENLTGSTVVYADQYTLERNLIIAGTVPNFSADTAIVGTTAYDQNKSFHYTTNNQHFSPLGHATRAQAVTPLVLTALAA